MKKLAILFCFVSTVIFSQQSGYRYGVVPEGGGYYQVPNKEIQAKSYASTSTIVTTHEETFINYGTLTGNLTLYSTVSDCYTLDRLTVNFKADGTARVITFSTGITARGSLTVTASTNANISFLFNGTVWVETSRQNLSGNVITDNITEKTSGSGITFSKAIIKNFTSTSYTANATVAASELAGGLLTVTSGTLTLTLPTASAIGTQLNATAGTVFDFVVQNSGSGGTVTVAVGSGIVASGFPSSNTLTLANSATIGIAGFRLTFISATAATLTRIN